MENIANWNGHSLIYHDEIQNIEKYELKYGVIIPPIYKSFISIFKTIRGEVYKCDKTNELKTLTSYKYFHEGEDLYFDEFLSIETSLSNRNNSESWLENKVMPIGLHSHGGGILVGLSEVNKDQIFYEYDSGIKYLEPNIYAFVKNMTFHYVAEVEERNLVKYWKNNYWSVK